MVKYANRVLCLLCVAAGLLLAGCPEAGEGPTASFSLSTSSGTAPLTVVFSDMSQPGSEVIETWAWEFGDGSSSGEANPSHVFGSTGVYTVSLTVTTSVDSSTATQQITVDAPQPPMAAFTASPESGDAPLAVQFTDASQAGTAAIATWGWDFGDGGSSAEQHPAHSFTAPGSYTVVLSVTSSAGSDTASLTIVVSQPPAAPSAAFTATPVTGFAPLEVTFLDSSAPGDAAISAWAWDFGDGGTSTTRHPTHTYSKGGTYTIRLTVTSSAGSDSASKTIQVTTPAPPQLSFTATPEGGIAPVEVAFVDTTVPGDLEITSTAWDFGDGEASGERNPTHTFAEPGDYTVTLTAQTRAGALSETQTISVAAPAPPTAAFDAMPETGFAPHTVAFVDTSDPGDREITDWAWDFGDGTTSTNQEEPHTYDDAGTYTVTLTVTSSAGSDSTSKVIEVREPIAPAALFTGVPASGQAPHDVVFTDTSLPGDFPITEWAWDFGDGSTSDVQHPEHRYANVGDYTVSLTVVTDAGSDTTTAEVSVSGPVRPTASFEVVNDGVAANLAMRFTDTSTPGDEAITSWAWDFGDGGTSENQNPAYTFGEIGEFIVRLTVTSSAGSTSVERTVQTTEPFTAEVSSTASALSGYAPLTVEFTGSAEPFQGNEVNNWRWEFGDETISDGLEPGYYEQRIGSHLPSPRHTYTEPGTYTAKLSAWPHIPGARYAGTATSEITVLPPVGPQAAFDAPSGSGVRVIWFQDRSLDGPNPITTWAWDFGDGATSSERNPTHAYVESGTYAVTLNVTDSIGNTDTATQSIRVLNSLMHTIILPNDVALEMVWIEPGTFLMGNPDGVAFDAASPQHEVTLTHGFWLGKYEVTLSQIHDFFAPGPWLEMTYDHPGVPVYFSLIDSVVESYLASLPPIEDLTFRLPTESQWEYACRAGTTSSFYWGDDPDGMEIDAYEWWSGNAFDVGEPYPHPVGTKAPNPWGLYDMAGNVPEFCYDRRRDYLSAPVVDPIGELNHSFMRGGSFRSPAPSLTSYVRWLSSSNMSMPRGFRVAAVHVPPEPRFSYDAPEGSIPLAVQFANETEIGSADIVSWEWDFGDGSTSSEESPSHVYDVQGEYAVLLHATDATGFTYTNRIAYRVLAHPQAETLQFGDVPLEVLRLAPQSFEMGVSPDDSVANVREWPRHTVTLTQDIWMGKYEVTKAQWQAVMGTTPWADQAEVIDDPDSPAVFVSWNDVQDFIAAAELIYGLKFRLPTEAEWEYACRAGTTTRFDWGSASVPPYIGWYADTAFDVGEAYGHPVGLSRLNPWGLGEMYGNVWEWCSDWYQSNYYVSSPEVDPPGPDTGTLKVIRGGTYLSAWGGCRSSARGYTNPNTRMRNGGFRLVWVP